MEGTPFFYNNGWLSLLASTVRSFSNCPRGRSVSNALNPTPVHTVDTPSCEKAPFMNGSTASPRGSFYSGVGKRHLHQASHRTGTMPERKLELLLATGHALSVREPRIGIGRVRSSNGDFVLPPVRGLIWCRGCR